MTKILNFKDTLFMTQSFTQKRKMSINLYIIQLIMSIIAFTSILAFIFISLSGSLSFGDYITPVAVLTIADIFFISALVYMSVKKPYSVLVDFSSEGISCKSNNIFISWADVKNIDIKVFGVESYFVISTTDRKPPYATKAYGKMTHEHIIVECRKELVPVIEQYWKEPIKKIEKYRKKNNNSYLTLIILASIPFVILLLIFLLYILSLFIVAIA